MKQYSILTRRRNIFENEHDKNNIDNIYLAATQTHIMVAVQSFWTMIASLKKISIASETLENGKSFKFLQTFRIFYAFEGAHLWERKI